MQKHPILYKIKNLQFAYKIGDQEIHALKLIETEIPAHALVCLSGPSGSGKSTLLNILGLMEPIQSGEVYLEDINLASIHEKQRNHIRSHQIGFIFQHFHLFPILNAEENVAYFLHRQGLPKHEIRERIAASLQQVGLWEHRHKRPLQMSGGQKQRVAIARALAKHPKVIIGDEPTASLDQKTGREIMDLLSSLCKEQNLSVVLASHDVMVHSYAEYHYHLQDGKIVC